MLKPRGKASEEATEHQHEYKPYDGQEDVKADQRWNRRYHRFEEDNHQTTEGDVNICKDRGLHRLLAWEGR